MIVYRNKKEILNLSQVVYVDGNRIMVSSDGYCQINGKWYRIGYKVLAPKADGYYPPKVANPGGVPTAFGTVLHASEAPVAKYSATGRPRIQAGGKGTGSSKIELAFRPGWHCLPIPYAPQFWTRNGEWPRKYVFCEVLYCVENDYTETAHEYGIVNGVFRHAYAGIPYLIQDGFYNYRTNPNPDAMSCCISSDMVVLRTMPYDEVVRVCAEHGVKAPALAEN